MNGLMKIKANVDVEILFICALNSSKFLTLKIFLSMCGSRYRLLRVQFLSSLISFDSLYSCSWSLLLIFWLNISCNFSVFQQGRQIFCCLSFHGSSLRPHRHSSTKLMKITLIYLIQLVVQLRKFLIRNLFLYQ